MITLLNASIPTASLDLDSGTGPEAEFPTVRCHLQIDSGVFTKVERAEKSTIVPQGVTTDLDGKLLFPAWADAHTHLDKTHTWSRSPNHSKTFPDAIETLFADERHWTEEDLSRRANYGLECAYAHGTAALRTHFNCPAGVLREPYAFFQNLASQWEGRIELQYVPLCTSDGYATPVEESYFSKAKEWRCAAIGGMPLMNPDLRSQIDRMFELARSHELALDLHIDENPDPASETLREIALGVLRHEFPFPVTCGHGCSLANQTLERQESTLKLVAEAGLNLIPLPMCNLFLMDRRARAGRPASPHWRGTMPALDALAHGIPVAVASDNVRDAFYAYGDYDMLEVWNQANRILYLDSLSPESITTVTSVPARIMELDARLGKIAPGMEARGVLFEAGSINQLLSRPSVPRQFLRGESIESRSLPDWECLN